MITVHRLEHDEVGTLGFTIVIDQHEDMQAFKQLVQRGANLWPDAPAAIKEFADLITNGQILQEYSKQDTSPKCNHEWHDVYRGATPYRKVCDKCGTTKELS